MGRQGLFVGAGNALNPNIPLTGRAGVYHLLVFLREATSQSPCLHVTLATAAITSETRKVCFISLSLDKTNMVIGSFTVMIFLMIYIIAFFVQRKEKIGHGLGAIPPE